MTSRIALVTGADRRLGAGIARKLAADGWCVAVNDLSEQATAAAVEDIQAGGKNAAAFPADVTDEAAVSNLVERIARTAGPVTAVVASASRPQPVTPLEALGWTELLRYLEFFAKSPLLLAKAVVPGMRAAGGGRIIHIGSDLFERGEQGWSAYMAAKGTMLGLTAGRAS